MINNVIGRQFYKQKVNVLDLMARDSKLNKVYFEERDSGKYQPLVGYWTPKKQNKAEESLQRCIKSTPFHVKRRPWSCKVDRNAKKYQNNSFTQQDILGESKGFLLK